MDSSYRNTLANFQAQQMTLPDFKAYQAGMGIYEERTKGTYMVRARLTAGFVTTQYLRALADLSARHGNAILHLTTRQGIQIHGVPLDQTPDVVEGLLQAGLSTRGGGGNAIRNISSSVPSACDGQLFDTTPYSLALTRYLLQFEGAYALPRKFKIAFSGCDHDCAQASITDLGFFAQIRDGARGFTVYAGGGMGRNPRPGILLEPFVAPHEIFEIAEAVRRLFETHGDRSNRQRARLRYVVESVGERDFLELYQHERKALAAEGLPGVVPEIGDTDGPVGDAVHVRLPLGDIAADKLAAIAELTEQFATGVVRTTQLQDLVLTGVPEQNKPQLLDALRALGLMPDQQTAPKIVACTGAGVCRLGVGVTRELAAAIAQKFAGHGLAFNNDAPAIRISGCPNSCGGHHAAAIGLEGSVKKVDGQAITVYTLYVDAKLSSQGATMAQRVATIPADKIPALLVAAFNNRRIDTQQLRELAPKYEVPDERTP